MFKVAALWLKTNENGEKFFVGSLNDDVSIFINKNKFKKADNQPDYIMTLAENKNKKNRAPAPKTDLPEDDF